MLDAGELAAYATVSWVTLAHSLLSYVEGERYVGSNLI